MKRILPAFLAFSMISTLLIGVSYAAPSVKVGASCTKLNLINISSGIKYQCVKSGKKLVWKSLGVVMVKPTIAPSPTPAPISNTTPAPVASPTPTPTPTPTPFKAKIPITLPVPQSGAITFSNAVSEFARIPQVAWQNVQDVIAKNDAVNVPTTIVIGPNTDTTEQQIVSMLQKEYKLWNGFQQPPSYTGLVYNAKDEAWAEAEWPKLAARMGLSGFDPAVYIPNHLRAGCNFVNNVATECYGGMALTFPNNDAGFAFYGVQSPYWSIGSLQAGNISQVTHEYTHNVQFAQWLGKTPAPNQPILSRSQQAHAGSPCWFSEGQANAIGIPIAATSVNEYIQGRDNSVRRGINTNTPTKPSISQSNMSAEVLTNFLYSQDPTTCYDPGVNGDWQLGYNLGYAATEALIAIGGPQSTMALLGETASGLTWADAFHAVYGISWKDGAVVLGKVLAAEYAAKPMDH